MRKLSDYNLPYPALLYLVTFVKYKNSSYYSFPKKKKSGGYRKIDAPAPILKEHQRLVNREVLVDLQTHKICPHGYVQGRSIVSNAQMHTNKEIVVNMDIQNFFPSITIKRVREIFLKNGWNVIYTKLLANFCTYKGVLPHGAPTSPTLTNAICYDMDKRLLLFCIKHKIGYTRYADDMTFSGREKIVLKCLDRIKEIIQEHDFIINDSKTRIMKKNQRQVVTGLVVNEKVNIKRQKYMNIRRQIYYCNKFGVKGHLKRVNSPLTPTQLKNKLSGQVENVIWINPKKGYKLSNELQKINWNS